MFSFAVAILAAGASSRMGRPKLLLPWPGGTVLADLVRRWRALGARQLAVVVAAESDVLADELDALGIPPDDRIVNDHPEEGMFSSVHCAARWKGWGTSISHWVLTLGDQPMVRTATLRSLLEFAALHAEQVCQPSRLGRPRHPVVLPASIFQRLAGSQAGNLKQFLLGEAGRRALLESDDDGLDFDLDEPADYERALQHLARRTKNEAT